MRYYPLFMNLRGAKILVAGAGAVGLRKVESLRACAPAEILLCDPFLPPDDFTAEQKALLEPPVIYAQRAASPEDLRGRGLVFACTGSRQANIELAGACRELGLPCNVADSPEESSFIVPAHFHEGGLTVALSTAGGSPALARVVKNELQAWMGGRYAPLLNFMAALRPRVLALGLGAPQDAALFRAVVSSNLGLLLSEKRLREAHDLLEVLLPPELRSSIGELLNDLS